MMKSKDTGITQEVDAVKSPQHYQRSGFPECKEIISGILDGYASFLDEGKIFWLGNVIKYLYRAPFKNGYEDLRKAAEYLNWIVNEEH